jgi:outer membrane protein assembly factor BamB
MSHGSKACDVMAALMLVMLILSTGGAVGAHDWPQFHGPRRDNLSLETGLLRQWPVQGPKLLWTAQGMGQGFACAVISQGCIYTSGNIGNDTVITCLTLDGCTKWTHRNGPAWKQASPGTRATPTIDQGRLFHENAVGDIVCLDAQTGRPIWSRNILKEFNGRNIEWGLSESLLIDGDHVICTPGGEKAGVVALDKSTGKTVWICPNTGDKPGYASPIAFEYQGLRQIVLFMAKSVVGIHAETGKLLWQVKHETPFDENINRPVFYKGLVIVASRTSGARALRVSVEGQGASVKQVWESDLLEPQHGGMLLLDDHLYAACRQSSLGPWVCLEAVSGRCVYAEKGIGTGSLTYADGHIYALSQKGVMALIQARPTRFDIVSQFKLPSQGRGPFWAHPVVAHGRLYIRHDDFLYCYDIRDGSPK